MADWPAKKNAAFTVTFPIYDADGDLVTGAADLDSEISEDGGTFTDCTNEATELATASGVYKLLLTADEMNCDIACTITKTSTTGAKTAVNVMYTVTRQLVDLAYPTTSGRGIDVEATGEVGINLDNVVGTLDAAEIGADAITAAKIADGAIDAATFAANAINAAAIADASIDAATFAAGAIDAAAIAADAIGASEIADGAIDAGAIAADAITAAKIADGAIDAGAIAADAITSAKIAADAIGASEIADGAIDAATFAAGAINAAAIADAAIDAATFAAGAIDAAAIATDAIGAAELAADAALEIADALLKRDIDQVEATMALHSLGTAILKAVSRIVDDAGTLKVYQTDGLTLHMSQTVTTDAALDPVDELTAGV